MNPRNIKISDYDYPLPDENIARHPLAVRDSCRLLVSDGTRIDDMIFNQLPSVLPSGAMMVCNDTRVINARLHFAKPSGAVIEIFCLEPCEPADYATSFATRSRCSWHCLVGNAKRWKEGVLTLPVSTAAGDAILTASYADYPVAPDNSRVIVFEWDNGDVSFADIISAAGEIPIPPYLCRRSEDSDTVDYQTVYSTVDGSVAAPTAGLHFTPALMDAVEQAGVEVRRVTLHVGAGTFRPVKSDTIGGHDMHSEFIAVSAALIDDLAAALSAGRHIVAVGTTTVRTLESLYHAGCIIAAGKWQGEVPQWTAYDGRVPMHDSVRALNALSEYLRTRGDTTFIARTRIIIAPGYEYRIVGSMITNFHQPSSTLLLLVSAFIGPQWRQVYSHALEQGYRFLSYGDACYFTRPGNK